jgi:hypothetical protein
MKTRVLNSSCKDHRYYEKIFGSIEPRWLEFEEFLKDMGVCPEGLTLDRIDNGKGYYPGNCRWATRKQQANNKKWGGKTKLTVDQVREIRKENSGLSSRKLGAIYGVGGGTICAIKNGTAWKEVANV